MTTCEKRDLICLFCCVEFQFYDYFIYIFFCLQYQKALSTLNLTETKRIGHQLEDMLLYCNYNGWTCSLRYTTLWTN